MVKESQFVKNIKKLERDGYKVDGATVLFTSKTGASSLIVEGDCSSRGIIVLRVNEHLKLENALAKARLESYVETETKSVLGNEESQSPSYTE